MTKLYIANPSLQHHEFHYQVPENPRTITKRISAGKQILVHEGPSHEVDMIINQHVDYGLKSVQDASRGRDFSGLIYSLDKPVSAENIVMIHEVNGEALNKMAEENRKVEALAINAGLEEKLDAEGLELKGVEVQTVEKVSRGQKASINETLAMGDITNSKSKDAE